MIQPDPNSPRVTVSHQGRLTEFALDAENRLVGRYVLNGRRLGWEARPADPTDPAQASVVDALGRVLDSFRRSAENPS